MLAASGVSAFAGCEALPADQAGTFGVSGARLAATAVVADGSGRPVSTLLDGALGFGGGYIVGLRPDKLNGPDLAARREEALRANDRAERNPAGAEDVAAASTADLNADGFVTVDEIVAMEQAGLTDGQEIARLHSTGQLFEVSVQQERYLEDRGISLPVIQTLRRMTSVNRASEPAGSPAYLSAR